MVLARGATLTALLSLLSPLLQGPSAAQPSAFIRFIYNRVILEAAPVRAAAVTALAKFATRCEDLRPSILPLLTRCLDDEDDEVRDRATLYLSLLAGSAAATPASSAATAAAAGGAAASATPRAAPLPRADAAVTRSLAGGRLPLPVAALQKAIALYQLRPAPGPFTFSALPHVDVSAVAPAAVAAAAAAEASAAGATSSSGGPPPEPGFGYAAEIRAAEAAALASKQARARANRPATAADASGGAAPGGSGGETAGGKSASSSSASSDGTAEALYKIPEFASLGALFRSSKPQELTEAELEYLVTVQKHVFADAVVFQFTVRNTVPEVLLERVQVAMQPAEPDAWRHIASIACPRVREGAPGTAYVALARSADAGFGASSFSCELKFNSREFDASAGEAVGEATPDAYPIDSVEVGPADFVAPVPVADFRAAWEGLGPGGEVLETFQLPIKSVADAVASVVGMLGMVCWGKGGGKGPAAGPC